MKLCFVSVNGPREPYLPDELRIRLSGSTDLVVMFLLMLVFHSKTSDKQLTSRPKWLICFVVPANNRQLQSPNDPA
jgi:hypothetical protein